ncbi:MAG: hypothetical protein ACRELF_26320 [Gemmataceae bacterium]
MSYADMVTILLAMLIVLSTLSSDQTGLTLYNGAASFAKALGSFGLPGFSAASPRPLETNYSTPNYLFKPGSESEDEGMDEPLQRFLQELQRQFAVERLRPSAGQVVIDLYEPLRRDAPYLAPHHLEALQRVRPLLDRPNYRLHLVVWTPTPRPSVWSRAAGQARIAADEFAAAARLPPDAAARLVPLAQPWRYRDIRRPILSLVVVKVQE